MLRFLLARLLWAVPALFGISLVTFLLMDIAPADRALIAVEQTDAGASAEARAASLRRFRERFGQIDPATGEDIPRLVRYGWWLRHASTLDFAAASDDPAAFRRRIVAALPVTLLVSFLSICLAVAVAVPLGGWLGLRAGGLGDRLVSGAMLVSWSLPEFLAGTLLLVVLGGGIGPALLPAAGLRATGAEQWSVPAQALDMAKHLLLPVVTLAIGPTVWLTRQVRESVARAAQSEFARTLRAWGTPVATLRARLRRHGLVPLATAMGALLPLLVSGSLVVERLFALPGLGDLACRAVLAREVPMVMALTTLVSVVTLFGLVVSDVLHRAIDPRVSLGRAR